MTFPFPSICPGNSKPLPFAFTSVANVAVNSLLTSNTITPTGYDTPALVVATGCEYSINGGAWTSLATYISPGQSIQIRATAPSAWSSSRTVSLAIDVVSATWTITTGAVTAGVWDTGWTTGSWSFTTPKAFNWLRIQLWGPGGGGGGGGGGVNYSGPGYPPAAGNGGGGSSGGIAQFNNGPYVTGGGGGGGGRGYDVLGTNGYGTYASNGGAGGWSGGDSGQNGGGAGGGGGGAGNATWVDFMHTYLGAQNGGGGGAGGYLIKTYSWGAIGAAAACPVVIQGPGGGGGGGPPSSWGGGYGSPGGSGGYGRCYIDWG